MRASEMDILVSSLIGKTKEEAANLCRANGYFPRVVREDKIGLLTTMDFRLDRIDLDIEKGLVTNASIG